MIDLEPACRRMGDVLAGVADDQLVSPTPCTGFTVGDLIDHIDEVARGFAAVARKDPDGGTGADPAPAATSLDAEWGGRVADHLHALGRAWADPVAWQGEVGPAGLDMPAERWGRIALTELVVHGWDLAMATGQPFDLPEGTLRACLDHVTEFVPNAPVPELWGTEVQVPAGAPLIDRVVAVTGRDPAHPLG